MIRTIIILSLILISTNSILKSQTGYLGKKVILKTNAYNGIFKPFRSVEVEYQFSKRFSVNLQLDANRKDVEMSNFYNDWKSYLQQSKLYSEYPFQANEPIIYSSIIGQNPNNGIQSLSEGNYQLKINRFSIGLKYYFTNEFRNAPFGFYTSLQYARSTRIIEGGSYIPNNIIRYDSLIPNSSKYYHSYSYYSQFYQEAKSSKIKGDEFIGGIGYQIIIKKIICIDLGFAAGVGSYTSATSISTNTVNIGPGVNYTFNSISSIYPNNYLISNLLYSSDYDRKDGYFLKNNVGNFDPFTGGLNNNDKTTSINLYFHIKFGFFLF